MKCNIKKIPGYSKTSPEDLGYDFRLTMDNLSENESDDFIRILSIKQRSKDKLNLEDIIRATIAIGKGKELQESVASQFNYAIGILTFISIASCIAFNNIDKDNLTSLKNLCLIGIPSYLLIGGIGHTLISFYKKNKVNSIIENY